MGAGEEDAALGLGEEFVEAVDLAGQKLGEGAALPGLVLPGPVGGGFDVGADAGEGGFGVGEGPAEALVVGEGVEFVGLAVPGVAVEDAALGGVDAGGGPEALAGAVHDGGAAEVLVEPEAAAGLEVHPRDGHVGDLGDQVSACRGEGGGEIDFTEEGQGEGAEQGGAAKGFEGAVAFHGDFDAGSILADGAKRGSVEDPAVEALGESGGETVVAAKDADKAGGGEQVEFFEQAPEGGGAVEAVAEGEEAAGAGGEAEAGPEFGLREGIEFTQRRGRPGAVAVGGGEFGEKGVDFVLVDLVQSLILLRGEEVERPAGAFAGPFDDAVAIEEVDGAESGRQKRLGFEAEFADIVVDGFVMGGDADGAGFGIEALGERFAKGAHAAAGAGGSFDDERVETGAGEFPGGGEAGDACSGDQDAAAGLGAEGERGAEE